MNWTAVGMLLITFGLGMALGRMVTELDYKEQAIKHACAQHDQKTGEFTWVTPTDQ